MTETKPERQCIACSKFWPLDVAHWYPHNECRGGFERRCRVCRNKMNLERNRMRRVDRGECIEGRGRKTKDPGDAICTQCYNISDRRPRIGKCKCGLAWEAEPRPEFELRNGYNVMGRAG